MYPGRYAISQAQANIPAVKFWRNVYGSNGVNTFEKEENEDGIKVVYQYFKTKGDVLELSRAQTIGPTIQSFIEN